MHKLAQTIAELAQARGATFHYGTTATRITRQNGRINGVQTDQGHIPADIVLFNGDPRALATGLLGDNAKSAVNPSHTEPRSLSALVHAFAAIPSGVDLAHHTVFFGHDPKAEFQALAKGEVPTDATLYLCAQDHGQAAPDAMQRFEIIMNAPPVLRDPTKEKPSCQTQVFNRFRDFGLTFSPTPKETTLTTPQEFDTLFPASLGSLYGRSPHGMMAAFKRPTARTKVQGTVPVRGRGASGGGGANGDALRPARGRGDHDGPCFHLDVPPNGYAWWYVDGISACGTKAVSVIGFIGSVFSPWYAWSGRKDPANHCCINVATYGPGGRFTMTDRGRDALHTTPDTFQVGPSSMHWNGNELVIDINEISSPPLIRSRPAVKLRSHRMR